MENGVATYQVSVVICAYTEKRWNQLRAAVASAEAQPETTEVIVVIDHNDALLRRARQYWGSDQVLRNLLPPGLAGARNTGLVAARSDIVAFLDDDAVAEPQWLTQLCVHFASPEVMAVGGQILPDWPTAAAPVILPPELWWVVGCSYRGLPTTTSDVRNIIGCSMVFRRANLLQVGGFSLDTGRVGRIPLGGEETDVCIRLRQYDVTSRIVMAPASRVLHHVPADRLTWKYLGRRSFYEGVSKSVLGRRLGAHDALSSERSYTRSVLPRGFIRELGALRPLGACAIALSLSAAACGYLYGWWQSSAKASVCSPVPSVRP